MANRYFHRAGARRHRVDHRVRGSCVGAHTLNYEFRGLIWFLTDGTPISCVLSHNCIIALF